MSFSLRFVDVTAVFGLVTFTHKSRFTKMVVMDHKMDHKMDQNGPKMMTTDRRERYCIE